MPDETPPMENAGIPENSLNTAGVTACLEAFKTLPSYVPQKEKYSIYPEIIATRNYLVNHQDLLMHTFGFNEAHYHTLLLTNDVDDFGKFGPLPVSSPSYNPHNFIARFYREARWTDVHTTWMHDHFEDIEPLLIELHSSDADRTKLQNNDKGRTLIPFRAALQVLAAVAKTEPDAQSDAVDAIFTLTPEDEAYLHRYHIDLNISFSDFATSAHTLMAPVILKQLGLPDPVLVLAPAHHLSSGAHLLPESIRVDQGLDGAKPIHPVYVQQAAITEYLDKIAAFMNRSHDEPQVALQKAKETITANVTKNYAQHPEAQVIAALYQHAYSFIQAHPLSNLSS